MKIGWFINHSDQLNVGHKVLMPAVERMTHPEGRKLHTLRAIKAGEEILMNYNDLGEPGCTKEPYYKQ